MIHAVEKRIVYRFDPYKRDGHALCSSACDLETKSSLALSILVNVLRIWPSNDINSRQILCLGTEFGDESKLNLRTEDECHSLSQKGENVSYLYYSLISGTIKICVTHKHNKKHIFLCVCFYFLKKSNYLFH